MHPDAPRSNAPEPPSLSEAFVYWLKLGFISFGGPAGQIAILHEDLVVRKRWISEARYLHALNYCMLLPGPEAQQLATYIGWLMHRTAGGLMAGGLFVLPSLFILMGLSWIYMAWGSVPAIAGVLYGIKPAVTAIVVSAAYRIGSRALRNNWLWGIALTAFFAIFTLQLPFPLIVLAAGVAGYLGGRVAPDKFSLSGAHGKSATPANAKPSTASADTSPELPAKMAAIIDDDTPTPAHARFGWNRAVRVVLAFLALWLAAIGALTALYGWNAVLTQMAWFFTKAALLTFGGAYAVLPYVYQGGVEQFHWLSAPQMIDGLALGETTPGPLIMVVAFVGFVGGWSKAIFGPDSLLLGASMAAVVVTFFTFVPSFFFIFLGGPFIESTHGKLKFTAPLSGITAAVVGVIVNLAAFFAYHVLWPKGFGGTVDWAAAVIGLAAAVALLRYKIGVIPVVLSCAAAGIAFKGF